MRSVFKTLELLRDALGPDWEVSRSQKTRRGGDGNWGGEDSRGCDGTETGGVWDERGRQSDH